MSKVPTPRYQVGDDVVMAEAGRTSDKNAGKDWTVDHVIIFSVKRDEWAVAYDLVRKGGTKSLRAIRENQLLPHPEWELVRATKGIK